MATYVLVHGASSEAWYWHRVRPQLRALGHVVIAPDLPVGDPTAGLSDYTDTILQAIEERVAQPKQLTDLVVVAHSMAGFSAPQICAKLPVSLLIMTAAMIPAPGESVSQWWTTTGYSEAKREQDEREGWPSDPSADGWVTFFHDLSDEMVELALSRPTPVQADKPFGDPWPLEAWPDVRTEFLLCRQDRFLPAPFLRQLVQDRLGFEPDEIDCGHLPALAKPDELVERLEAYRTTAVDRPRGFVG